MAVPTIVKIANMNTKEDLHEEPAQIENLTHDDDFGEITDEGPNFRNDGFVGTIILMMKTQIGLVLDMVPGIICLLAMAVITTWSGYIIGAFKLQHREVYSIDDAGGIMFGLPGRVVLSTAFCLYYVFNSGSAILGISIGLNAVSTHATCTAVSVAVAAIVGFLMTSVRYTDHILTLSVVIVTIAVGVQDRPAAAPRTEGPWVSDWRVAGNPTFTEGIERFQIFFLPSRGRLMRDPRKYTTAMVCCQAGVTIIYPVIGCIVYCYCGSYVSSPALGSAGDFLQITTNLYSADFSSYIPAKFIFVHLLRGSRHLNSNTPTHWLTWLGCTFGLTLIAWIIASTIPVFDSLVSLIGALLGPVMCIQPMGAMGADTGKMSKKWMLLSTWSVFLVILGSFLMVAGTYGSIRGILDSYAASGGSAAFSCKDNSNSV
ncbi:uncharacterized protein BDV17DRAFT_280056 [Aspergillus undulatus]|uniref:uncharacterized protein n=1 Tax=Aspergillus undulatus TaxID=1810928 RepID=UPI003CCE11D5